ncbi:hypothetical protein H8356DRAFT_1420553 [Neocallimastix lanati (nom. inval.)]|nr:hypothetical protein H8356DRAFT_1420553 [Neocallimastix sp. JGI-2020a]
MRILKKFFFEIKRFSNFIIHSLYWFMLGVFHLSTWFYFTKTGTIKKPNKSCSVPWVYQAFSTSCQISGLVETKTFLLFAVCCVITSLYSQFYVIECKGLSLEEMDQTMADKA